MATFLGLFFFTLGVSCAPDPFKEDYFHWFLETQRNPKIDPCENFYRHVCPVGISEDDSLGHINKKTVLRWVMNGKKTLEAEKEWEVLKNGDFSPPPPPQQQQQEQQQPPADQENTAALYYGYISNLFQLMTVMAQQLPRRLSVLYDVMKNPENPLFRANLTRIKQVTDQMKDFLVNKIQVSDQYSKEFKEHAEVVVKNLITKTAFVDETDYVIQMYKKMLTNIGEINRQSELLDYRGITKRMGDNNFPVKSQELNISIENVSVYLKEFAKGISNITDSHILLIAYNGMLNSANFVDHVSIMEPFFLLTFMSNTSISTVLAQYGYVVGHEIGHSFVKETGAAFLLPPYYPLESDPVYKEQLQCLRRKMEKICILWGETNCESGTRTLKEDGPDDFSISAAYEILKGYLGNDAMKEYEYDDLKITKEQLFFYSTAIMWCFPYGTSQHAKNDVHSGTLARINGMFSVMPEFHKAFNCHKHQLMVQPDRCSFYDTKNSTKN